MSPWWLSWRRWSSTRQNLWFEIETARGDISRIKALGARGADQAILCRCEALLAKAEKSFWGLFPQELFIWSALCEISQDMLLLIPLNELEAKLTRMESRLSNFSTASAAPWKRVLKNARRVLAELLRGTSQAGASQAEPRLRSNLRAMDDFLNDRLIAEIWWSIRLRRFSTLFAVAGVVSIGVLVWLVAHPQCCQGEDGTLACDQRQLL